MQHVCMVEDPWCGPGGEWDVPLCPTLLCSLSRATRTGSDGHVMELQGIQRVMESDRSLGALEL